MKLLDLRLSVILFGLFGSKKTEAVSTCSSSHSPLRDPAPCSSAPHLQITRVAEQTCSINFVCVCAWARVRARLSPLAAKLVHTRMFHSP